MVSESIRRLLAQEDSLRRLMSPLDEAETWRASSATAALDAASPLLRAHDWEEERWRQLASIANNRSVGGLASEALLHMADEVYLQHHSLGGAINEIQQLGLLEPGAHLGDTLRAAAEASRAYEQFFRRPTPDEVLRLANDAIHSSALVARAFDEQEALSDLQARMDEMLSPWINSAGASASARAFADVQAIGQLVKQAQSFETPIAEMLRASLGDWRDQISPPMELLTDTSIRRSLYMDRGFDATLTEFTPQAFDEGLQLAFPPVDDESEFDLEQEGDGGYARARVAFNVLQQFEVAIRRFIDGAMRSAYGDDWPRRQLPSGMHDRWLEKKESARKAGEEDLPIIEYADFTDYRLIIERKDNWNHVFKPVFGRADSVRESFQRLYPVRIATMHARVVTMDDHIFLMAETRRVLRAIRVGP